MPILRAAQPVSAFHYAHYELTQLIRTARIDEGIEGVLENTIVRLTPKPPRGWDRADEESKDDLVGAGIWISVACLTPGSLKMVRALLGTRNIQIGTPEDEKAGYSGTPTSRARARAMGHEVTVKGAKRAKQACQPGQAGGGAGKGGRGGK